ncbi:unnamed protein product [Schistosoma intercalatum]|nr:unnamed protein product [Schistosoma intercalatum]CAH8453475.1 unnamed protein product [Schistosoma intercalatum]
MSKPPKSVFQDGDTNCIIISMPEHTMPNLCITDMVLPLNVSNPSETAMIEHRESSNVLNSERPGFTSIEKNCSHRRVVDPAFYSQTNITKAPKVAQIGISRSGFHYSCIDLITHTPTSTYAATQIHELLNYVYLLTVQREYRIGILPVL